jgi:hypothetical protein
MPTQLQFSSRSEFFEPIEAAIRAAGGKVVAPLRVTLKRGGYARSSSIFLGREASKSFVTDWESNHPSRFSARCRAAATVLQRTGHAGWFHVRHEDGLLVIEPTEARA